jgi:hypothetical protein
MGYAIHLADQSRLQDRVPRRAIHSNNCGETETRLCLVNGANSKHLSTGLPATYAYNQVPRL